MLSKKSKEIEVVVVKSNNKILKIDKPEMSVNKLSIAQIKQMPAVLGEVDVIALYSLYQESLMQVKDSLDSMSEEVQQIKT